MTIVNPQSVSASSKILQSIHSMVVLYGSVRTTPLARKIGRSLLDLPLSDTQSILAHQLDQATKCSKRFSLDHLKLRVLVDSDTMIPSIPESKGAVSCEVEHDGSPIRGVAGVLADATKDIPDDQYIIMASGAQVYLEPLADLVQAMAKKEADISFVSTSDGAPVGVWLIRCGVLKSVNPIGYVDLKEQSLKEWKLEHKVSVVERNRPYVLPARSLHEYLDALRAQSTGFSVGSTIDEDPFREDWESNYSIIEQGSQVHEDAVLHDSIALKGSTIGKGAVIVRSVVCPGANVAPGARVADKVLTGVVKKEGRRS